MPTSLSEQIKTRLIELEYAYHRLLLVVAPPGSWKTDTLQAIFNKIDFLYINLGIELSQRLLELTDRQRSLRIPLLIDDILGNETSQPILLDNTEILFDVSLQQDPLRLLQGISRNRIIVVAWSGRVQGDYLIYAEPGHPEYKRYTIKGLCLVIPN